MIVIKASKIGALKNEAGGHRIQRVPPTERRGRVHTSTVTVSVLEEGQVAVRLDKQDLEYRWFSGTGKGGQHRNKHQNCLELTHLPTGLKQTATGRSRDTNEREAKDALLLKLQQVSTGQANDATNAIRSGQIGCGMRGDKRRTYRFQDDQIVDHLTGKKMSCQQFMSGNIEKLS